MNDKQLVICFVYMDRVWYFFSAQGNLYYEYRKKDSGEWSEPGILQSDFDGEYAISLGPRGSIHMVARSSNVLEYHRWSPGDGWRSIPVENAQGEGTPKFLSITSGEGESLHLVSTVYRGSGPDTAWQIIHRYWDGKWKTRGIDSGEGDRECKSSLALDSKNRLHLVYQKPSHDGPEHCLFYRTFIPEKSTWTEKMPVPGGVENREPCPVADKDNRLHLVWITSDGKNLRAAYARMHIGHWPNSGWDTAKLVSPPGRNAYSPVLIIRGSRVRILWQEVEGVFQRTSEDSGKTWTAAVKKEEMEPLSWLTLAQLKPDVIDAELLELFSSTGPQLALMGASLAGSNQGPDTSRALTERFSDLYPQEKALSYKVKKLLMSHNDSMLSNRIMHKTIADQEETISSLTENAAQLKSKIEQQVRDLNNQKSFLKMHIKDNKTLKKEKKDLQKAVARLEESLGRLQNDKKRLDAVFPERGSEKAAAEEDPGQVKKRPQPSVRIDNVKTAERKKPEETKQSPPERKKQAKPTIMTLDRVVSTNNLGGSTYIYYQNG